MHTPSSSRPFLPHVCPQVLLGASGVLSNGAVLAPAGSATVAALARSHQVEVWIAAESFKLSDRVHLDSVVYNEMGSEYVRDPHLFVSFMLCFTSDLDLCASPSTITPLA